MLRHLLLMIVLMVPAFSGAMERVVPANDGALVKALKTAQAGDVLRLSPGIHMGADCYRDIADN